MSSPPKTAPVSLATPDEITARHRALERSIAGYKPADATNAVIQALRYFEEHSRPERERLLTAGVKDKTDQSSCLWVADRYELLLRLARDTVLRAFAEASTDAVPRAPISAAAILLSGHAVKWRKFAGGRRDTALLEWLHQIFRTAVAFAADSTVLSVRIEDRQVDATVEALYVRALLLDRFSGGNLTPRRLEILDNWLVQWMGSLWLTRAPVEGELMLGVNTTDALRGLTPHVPEDNAHLFLSLRPLKRQLERSIREYHLGKLFPGWGVGHTAPMEEHVGVIEFLEREFTLIERAGTKRNRRIQVGSNSIVGVFFGFDEICKMAFSAERLHSLSGGGTQIGIRNAINLIDISEGGLGLDMVEEDARRVSVGDLLAIRLEKGRPCVLGMVVRKSALSRPSATLVGVRVFTKSPVYTAMDRLNETNNWLNSEGILIAGSTDDGFADSVIVSDKTYVANSPLAVTMHHSTYVLHMRRVRQQGPGWRMAAYDAELAA